MLMDSEQIIKLLFLCLWYSSQLINYTEAQGMCFTSSLSHYPILLSWVLATDAWACVTSNAMCSRSLPPDWNWCPALEWCPYAACTDMSKLLPDCELHHLNSQLLGYSSTMEKVQETVTGSTGQPVVALRQMQHSKWLRCVMTGAMYCMHIQAARTEQL